MEVRFYPIGFGSSVLTANTTPTAPTSTTPAFQLVNIAGWDSHALSANVNELVTGVGGVGPRIGHRGMKQMAVELMMYGSSTPASFGGANGVEKIAALAGEGIRLRMEVTDYDGVDKFMEVYVNGTLEVDYIRRNAARVFIPVIAPDPRKYATALQQVQLNAGGSGGTSTSSIFNNVGSAPAYMRIFVTAGSIPTTRFPFDFRFMVSDYVQYTHTSAVNANIEMLPDYGGILIDASSGQAAFGTMTVSATDGWPNIDPGSTRTAQIQIGGSGAWTATLYLRMYSTWW